MKLTDEQIEAMRQVIDKLELIEAEATHGFCDGAFIAKLSQQGVGIVRLSFKEIR